MDEGFFIHGHLLGRYYIPLRVGIAVEIATSPGRILSGLAENSSSAQRVTNVLDEYINLTTDDTAIYHPQRWDGAKLAHELALRYHSGEANSHNKGA
jgi:hypothetical protein